ncbi:YugN-like family protein [Bacillus alkalicellulosilyticus]|uniref:YugN-like family protein n=1 Tax=Alkalihalobacterium alkalicellulosilyticum TaxID=1912214 RepID=UPI0009966DBF|nr:YugN-like family protein [Bacillus alkalicellulosilyticus]
MIPLQSAVEHKEFVLYDLEQKLKPLGYVIGGNWDYDHGYFDYKIDDDGSYIFFRLPFEATNGELEQRGVKVRLMKPFLLAHKYQRGLDDYVGDKYPVLNQFSEPQDKDASIKEKYIPIAQNLIQELEATILYL